MMKTFIVENVPPGAFISTMDKGFTATLASRGEFKLWCFEVKCLCRSVINKSYYFLIHKSYATPADFELGRIGLREMRKTNEYRLFEVQDKIGMTKTCLSI